VMGMARRDERQKRKYRRKFIPTFLSGG